jgi:hypothetical protein
MPRDDVPAKYPDAESPLPGETLESTRAAQRAQSWLNAKSPSEERRRILAVRRWLHAHQWRLTPRWIP